MVETVRHAHYQAVPLEFRQRFPHRRLAYLKLPRQAEFHQRLSWLKRAGENGLLQDLRHARAQRTIFYHRQPPDSAFMRGTRSHNELKRS
jgi:hypothetical protein